MKERKPQIWKASSRHPAVNTRDIAVAETKKASAVTTVLREVGIKDRLEAKAFSALERRLEPQNRMCKPCKGEGSKADGESCAMCQGQGFVVEDADMRAVELVLAPKFPKTQLNLNADIDGMSTEDLLNVIEAM